MAEARVELAEFAGRNLPEDDVYSQATVRLAEALAATGREDRDEAVPAYEDAVRLYEGLHLPIETGQTRIAFARALRTFGDPDTALGQLEQARRAFERIQAIGIVAQIDGDLADVKSGTGRTGPARSS